MIAPPIFSKQPVFQFRAGLMKYANGIVTPDKRKGYVSLIATGSNIIELVWGSSREAVESIPLPRGKTTVKFVEQCTTGRVLLFETGEGSEKKMLFYWLQEKSDEKDSTYLASLQQVFSERPPPSAKHAVGLEDFKKILATVSKGKKDVSLVDVLASPIVTEELSSEAAFYQAALAEHLPKNVGSPEDMLAQVKNPQVSQAAAMLQAALQDPLMYKQICTSFGIPETDANGGVFAFLNGVMKRAKDSKEGA